MLSLKHASKTRGFLSPSFILNNTLYPSSSSALYTSADLAHVPNLFLPPSTSPVIRGINAKDVVSSVKEWFKSRDTVLLDQIFQILRNEDTDDLSSRRAADMALSRLGFPLSEEFVLKVLYHNGDVLSSLKFFDWAGRQPGFNHSQATFTAIFKILSKAKLMSLMLDFLDNYKKHRSFYKVRFHCILVMGYAVAGKPDIALQMFGQMRYQGQDLDNFSYHVMLNALVEQQCFDAVEVVTKQIRMRGFESEVTQSIIMKSYCKQGRLSEGESFLQELVNSRSLLDGSLLSILVDALCKSNKFDHASKLMEEFGKSGMIPMESAYSIWIRHLVQARQLDGALEFLQIKKSMEGYVPDLFRYNLLIWTLLKQNRLNELCDMLMEMKEGQISPNKATMSAALCFFCKAGMVDAALELYNCSSEFVLSPSTMAYNYLINTLCGDGSIDEAYFVLKNSLGQGCFPGQKTFNILADALCREGKLDKMKELVIVALEKNFIPSNFIFDKFISTLCSASRVEDGYLIHGELNRINKVANKKTYFGLIHGFNKSNRGDIAARLLIEMQEKGHKPNKELFRAVIGCLFDVKTPENQFIKLLEMQLSLLGPTCNTYNLFIDGAGHANKPEVARIVFEMMQRAGIEPNMNTDILMLQSYLKGDRISDALNFFNNVRQRRNTGRKLYHSMIVGLCKVNRMEIALDVFREMKDKGLVPSVECYEKLIWQLSWNKRYDVVVNLINDYNESGRHITSFIGNVLLFHASKSQELYDAWVRSIELQNDVSSSSLLLCQLIGAFTGRISEDKTIGEMEEMISQCFPLDLYTYNMLLRRVTMNKVDDARELFTRMCKKGYEPNRWTYDILVYGLIKHGRIAEARCWAEEMFRKGFDLTKGTERLC